jgi:Flp pilus assembly pilin Flp
MSFSDGFKVLGWIVALGVVAVIAASPHVSKDIQSFFHGFGFSISSAKH